jgi:hypothetical protein
MVNTKTLQCNKCSIWITSNNYNRHILACNRTYFAGTTKPNKKSQYESITTSVKKRVAWNKGLTKEINDRVKAQSDSMIQGYKTGRIAKPKPDINKSRETALKHGFGGYRENAGKSKKFRVDDSFGKQVCLQSSYEFRCSEILNELGIKWIRPKFLKYELEGKVKNYFPDFFLVDYNIYLDPKNSYLAIKDKEKIKSVIDYNSVNVVILLEEQLTIEYIKQLCM